jgi:hypothetical protein
MEADSSPVTEPLSFDHKDDRAAGFPAGALRQALEHFAESDGLIERTNGIRQSHRSRGMLGRTTQRVAQLAKLGTRSVGIPTRALDVFQRGFDVFASGLELLPCGFEIAMRVLSLCPCSLDLCPRSVNFRPRPFGLGARGIATLPFGVGLLFEGVGLATGGFDLLLTLFDSTLELVDLPLVVLAHLVKTTLQVFDLPSESHALFIGIASSGLADLGDLTIRIATHLGPGTVCRFSGNAGTCLLSCLNQIVERRHVFALYGVSRLRRDAWRPSATGRSD